ncbi:MAG: adenosine kinase [Pirellulaceae bacterium]|nr:adenosine kinase [Pirellulaceae bacterium]
MRDFSVCGLGNAIVDIFLEVDDVEFKSLGFERGTMRLVDANEQRLLLERFHNGKHDLKLVSGGSVANSIIGLSQLGGTGAFIGCVGDDRYGMHYADEFENLKIEIGNPILVGETTGTCIALITPDAERTMRTCLAISSELAARHVDADRIRRSEWLFIEGYVFANAETGQKAIQKAIKVAKESGTKIALTCSDAFIPEVFGDAFREALLQSDLIFCNAPEAMAVTKTKTSDDAFKALSGMVGNSIVTDGPNGAYVRYEGTSAHVAAFPCQPKDLTGAGDMFAGAFLYGITHGFTPEVAVRGANFMSMKVISQIGARLHQGVQGFWKEGIS